MTVRRNQEEKSDLNIIKTCFKQYYRNPDSEIKVTAIEQREFAYQPFERDVMVRHISFKTVEDLRKFLVNVVPAHVYHSVAYYAHPDIQDMEKKGWKGADLVFDIDADHLDTEACREASSIGVITAKCLEDAQNEAIKLVEVLQEEFGLSRDEIKITFSGHRGFHVHIESETVRELGQDERREIIDYLLARSFDIAKLVVERKPRAKPERKLPVGEDVEGIGRRLWKILMDVIDHDELKDRIMTFRNITARLMKKLSEKNAKICEMLSIHVDEIVTLDIKRLIRVPNTLHGKTGLKVAELSIQDLYQDVEHIISRAVPRNMKKGTVKILLKRKLSIRNVLDQDIELRIDEPIDVPLYIAIYLTRLGFAELVM